MPARAPRWFGPAPGCHTHVAIGPELVDPRVHPLTFYCSTCFYPKSVSTFDLASYLGTWYQVAGYEAIFTAGCKCVTANYSLNDDGTVGVKNQCEAVGLPITITGSAAPVDPVYGDGGAFEVTFFNATNACPGPNYIVQGKCSHFGEIISYVLGLTVFEEYVVDDYAIVQAPDFATLFVLSREQNVTDTKLDVSTRSSTFF